MLHHPTSSPLSLATKSNPVKYITQTPHNVIQYAALSTQKRELVKKNNCKFHFQFLAKLGFIKTTKNNITTLNSCMRLFIKQLLV